MHTFDNVLTNKKWDGIIVCGGIIVCIVPVSEGGGGEEKERPLLHKYYQLNKPRTSAVMPSGNVCKTEGAGLKEVNT